MTNQEKPIRVVQGDNNNCWHGGKTGYDLMVIPVLLGIGALHVGVVLGFVAVYYVAQASPLLAVILAIGLTTVTLKIIWKVITAGPSQPPPTPEP